ncbi:MULTISPECIES: flagellar hook-length control protein FliK [unclassified Duganella]|uniref:flagellar hook-length control protein FliK n=1 Tax=unclassified Duganella TaxID=2636909 RepID=UPI000E3437F0|nr:MULTISPECIES: flagellar hook-length control protein FliK [unclassified Duganella]RFP14806.1 flagellar hook-length control protein FliK [Duganella sp. BJB475]RFP31155.1 flagellar hook-length control protein FliK [Duganella sp. BJB476]
MLPPVVTILPVGPAADVGGVAPVGDGRQAAFQRALQSLVGQSVTAEVLSKFNDGSFLVKVADNAVRMMLPPEVQVGAEVPLTVLTANPRPTFQLGNNSPGSSATLVYSEPAEAGDGLYSPALPSQDAPAALPPTPRPPAGAATPGQPATPGASGAAAGLPAEADGLPGQLKPGTPAAAGTPAGTAAPATGAAQAAAAAAGAAGATAETAENPATTAGRPANTPAATASTATPATTAPGTAATPTAAGAAAVATDARAAAPAAGAGAAPQAGAAAAQSAGGAAPTEAVKPQSLAATLLGKAPLTPSNELPDLDPSTPQATLSNTARVLTTVLSTAQGSAGAQLALVGKSALFGNAAPAAEQLAQKLQDTISQSGLFYESHVTEWAKGERTLPELMREPQMQRMLQSGESAARAAASGPDLSAAQLINQQLHTHEQGRVQWNGEAWPGQHMQWEIRREQREGRKDEGNGADGEPEQVWRSGVRFRFPMLGAVSAAVTLIGGQVHIQVQADDGDTADTLRAYASQLEQAMEAAGAPLSSLTIGQEPP